jgi:hypothetical protein
LGGFCGVGFVILVTFSTKKTLQRWWHPEPPFRIFRSLENGSQKRRCTVLFQFQRSPRSLPIPGGWVRREQLENPRIHRARTMVDDAFAKWQWCTSAVGIFAKGTLKCSFCNQ